MSQNNSVKYGFGERRRMKKPIDKTKKSNIKCEHCEHWDGICTGKSWVGHNDAFGCTNKESTRYNTPTNYWNRCKCFEWKGEG